MEHIPVIRRTPSRSSSKHNKNSQLTRERGLDRTTQDMIDHSREYKNTKY